MPASIPLCQNHGLCTAECPYRPSCRKARTPLLIPTLVVHYRTRKVYKDEYINELAQIKQESVDLACHQGGKDIRHDLRLKLRMETI